MANKGKKTAVKINPAMAAIKWLPDSMPRKGGKIKFPAPKNKEKSINPENNIFLRLRLKLNPPKYYPKHLLYPLSEIK